MDTRKIKQPLSRFIKALSDQIHIERVIIFGSYVHGSATKQSDIDVIVISDDFSSMREDKRLQILDKASHGISPEIQAWGVTPKELEEAGTLSTLGYARSAGHRFL